MILRLDWEHYITNLVPIRMDISLKWSYGPNLIVKKSALESSHTENVPDDDESDNSDDEPDDVGGG
ncbi:8392_t:CDS:2 [Ambispora gerdemannii]|uniref:8392_t:CDS:1 n=1 Tax=Ambispora gerdemannii TaxID=144530 RepID=A0A9N9CNJ2_9GLOM|nr:8392_t:CDS:2 [Ambispora gerdemannii]